MATSALPPPAGTPLARELAETIRHTGPMAFEEFMSRCLYDPIHGYYASPGRAVGRRGDFYTSVSVGPVFGELIAAWVAKNWGEMGSPASVRLVEQGAHDGRLMADVLDALGRRHPVVRAAAHPIIVEPLNTRREEQRQQLEAAVTDDLAGPAPASGPAVCWVESLDELAARPSPHTLFFANELLDAFPVARWRFEGRSWQGLSVALNTSGTFVWQPRPSSGFRPTGAHGIDEARLPEGYETETCPGLGGWTRALARSMGRGRALVFDYGRDAADYFAPHRTAGTLRGYHGHRRCDDPFVAPGQTDLTADVNFTDLAAAAEAAGFAVRPPERQGAFLTRLAMPRLLETPAPDPLWLRQFQTLTHPNHLGHVFHAVALEKFGAS